MIRRLSHSEYHYTILDLVNVDFDVRNYFPSDGSGGGGFDNQGGALFFTPLKLERYYDAADSIIDAGIIMKKSGRILFLSSTQNWFQRFVIGLNLCFRMITMKLIPPDLQLKKSFSRLRLRLFGGLSRKMKNQN